MDFSEINFLQSQPLDSATKDLIKYICKVPNMVTDS